MREYECINIIIMLLSVLFAFDILMLVLQSGLIGAK